MAWAFYLLQMRSGAVSIPRPGIAEPESRQQVQLRCLGPAIEHIDADENVFNAGLGIFDEDVEVTVIIKDASIDQFELSLTPATVAVLLDQQGIRKFSLRIFVEVFHVGMR